MGDNKVLNFADGTLHTDKNMEYITYMFGQRVGNAQLSALSKELFSYHVPYEAIKEYLFALIYEKDILAQPAYEAGEVYFLPCVQVASIRRNHWFFGAKGGSKEHLGNLVSYSEENGVEIEENGKNCVYAKSEVAQVRLRIKF